MKCILCVIVISIQIRQSNELTRIDEFRKLQFVESKTNNLQIESNDIGCQLTEFIGIPFISPLISRDLVCKLQTKYTKDVWASTFRDNFSLTTFYML